MPKTYNLLDYSNKFLVVFSCCISVKGARRSTICDLQRETFDFIPNILYTILTEFKGKKFKEIVKYCGEENQDVLHQYITFLIDKEYIFFSDEPEKFPSVNLDWKSPHEISNAIIDFDASSNHDIELLVSELDKLRCPAVQLRFFFSPKYNEIIRILKCFEDSGIRTIELILKYSNTLSLTNLKILMDRFQRVSSINVTSSPKRKEFTYQSYFPNILFQEQVVDSANCCGTISQSNFRVNISLFTEAQKFSSCLNRKVGIDKDGLVKNCPTSKNDFGKFEKGKLASVLKNRKFQELWSISKDMVEICKDCEFRYICTDCRIVANHKFSKPLKCKYDPYSATWK